MATAPKRYANCCRRNPTVATIREIRCEKRQPVNVWQLCSKISECGRSRFNAMKFAIWPLVSCEQTSWLRCAPISAPGISGNSAFLLPTHGSFLRQHHSSAMVVVVRALDTCPAAGGAFTNPVDCPSPCAGQALFSCHREGSHLLKFSQDVNAGRPPKSLNGLRRSSFIPVRLLPTRWLVVCVCLFVSGKVYNVTRYLDFHPGGEQELMRGVGSDATDLFNQVHAWVNYESMLGKCLVGHIVHTPGSTSPKKAPLESTMAPPKKCEFSAHRSAVQAILWYLFLVEVSVGYFMCNLRYGWVMEPACDFAEEKKSPFSFA